MKLPTKDPQALKFINTFGRWKFAKAFTKLYNMLCDACKRMVINNPKGITDAKPFCAECKPKVQGLLDKLDKARKRYEKK